MSRPAYKRILLKISGEVLAGEQSFGIDSRMIDYIASEIAEVAAMGVEVAVVIGGGNIFRGLDAADGGMERASADYMGMLATMLNALALQNALEKRDVVTRIQSAIEMRQLAEGYIRRRAIRHLEKKRVIIFAAGTGNPYFSTDTAAALRAMEIGAEIILKRPKVMDSTAISLCMDHNLPIIVFNVKEKGNIKRIVRGEQLGTLVHDEPAPA